MSNVGAVEHIGLAVPDLEQATTFFAEAEVIRMLRLGNGPNIELFTYSGVAQRDPVVPSAYGLQHFCVHVDDIDAAAAQLVKAGGTPLSEPGDLPGGDAGPGNRYLYARTPWGSTIELVTYPSPQAYAATTDRRRWPPAR